MTEDNERRPDNASQALYGAERGFVSAMQNLVDAQTKAGKSKRHALEILSQLLREAREEKAKRHRAGFKIVE